jgi:peptidyl-prolyl cis-trans isomerase SurA
MIQNEDAMRVLAITLLFCCSIGLNSVSAEVVSRIAAVVNKDIITTHQLDQKLQEQLANQEQQPSPAQLGVLRQELLSRLIEETLVQQRIKALNLKVSESEIETALQDVQNKNHLTREQLEEAVSAQGMDFDAYRENLGQQILRYKLIGEEVRRQVDVPEREVVEYYRAHLDEYRLAPEVQLSAITFPISKKASDQERQQILKVAGEALARLRQQEDMSVVVASYTDNYGATGSELGNFVVGELTQEFANAIFDVEPGGYSEPIVTETAVRLLRVDARNPGGLRQFDTVKNDIHQMILDQKTDVRIKEWTKSLKTNAFIDIRL